MTTTVNDIIEEKTNTLIFANYYVILTNGSEEKKINTVKGGYNPNNKFHSKALSAIKADPTRLLSRPTLSTGEKIYTQTDEELANGNADGWN